jgi:hypothetical protein
VTGCRGAQNASLAEYLSSINGNSHGDYGLEVEGDGLPGSLAAFALAPHYHGRDTVFSAVPFYDPNLLHSSATIFAGVPAGTQPTLPYGTYVPRLSFANFSAAPLHLSVALADSSSSADDGDADNNHHANKIQSLTVAPHQTGEFVFKGIESISGLSHSVIVKGDGDPGSYQAKLVSRSDGRLYQVELLAKDGLDINNSGIHPWSIDDETESHLILFNHSNSPKKVGFTITSGTRQWRHEFMLAGMETREINFNEIEKQKTPDDFGRILRALLCGRQPAIFSNHLWNGISNQHEYYDPTMHRRPRACNPRECTSHSE